MTIAITGRFIARLGDKSDHGGVIITADPVTLINGIPAARIGDLHACPQYWGDTPHGTRPIIPIGCLSNRGIMYGRIMALEDDMTTCGAKIKPTQDIGASNC